MYNYSTLIVLITSFGGVEKLAQSIGVDYRTLGDKLLNKRKFSQQDIEDIIQVLNVERTRIFELFFQKIS